MNCDLFGFDPVGLMMIIICVLGLIILFMDLINDELKRKLEIRNG